MSTDTAGVQEPTELRRVMGPKLLLLFIVGDILGAGIYAVTGQMAGKVGGLVWLPFLLAFVVASMTALSYLELVTKYPQAAGAALYAHKAFGIHFVTFLIAFAVVCSGITSASTSAKTLADNFTGGLEVNGWIDGTPSSGVIVAIAMGFMILLAIINLRGVGESVKFNVVLTIVELAALSIVIGVGFYAMTRNGADLSEIVTFRDYEDRGLFLAVTAATSIAFFAMVGFEDAVNMVEEVKEPNKIFPRTMLTGLGIAVILYMLVAVSVVAVLTAPELKNIADSEGRALLEVVSKGAPDFPIDRVFPFLAVFAVANTALINMLMASRLLYGMAKQGVLPRQLGAVLPGRRTPWVAVGFSTVLALGLIFYVTRDADSNVVANLSNVTAFLLLCVFAIVNVACLILRRDTTGAERNHFMSPGVLPAVAAFLCLFLAGPWVDRDPEVYKIAGALMLIGVALWVVTYFINKATGTADSSFEDVEGLGG
ncbi:MULTISPECIES: APC family permease [unclassified Aeromicrobium]|uniref:APC family permease n=1 Tax=unclassified Aeromicrobium TaxID=2633570 RepID=UPI0006F5AFD9|nr:MULTISPECIES: APC family permease [unclassified Aeromicrobium]KQO38997.1 amino acid permease [Aeromicrobium sp. Leaf245]KQP79649.1 amino acid permease [Aeromicrobium sp. Leaf289]KQP82258.1 amino acid permease [Aeromicrobium sp. Leaf291]